MKWYKGKRRMTADFSSELCKPEESGTIFNYQLKWKTVDPYFYMQWKYLPKINTSQTNKIWDKSLPVHLYYKNC